MTNLRKGMLGMVYIGSLLVLTAISGMSFGYRPTTWNALFALVFVIMVPVWVYFLATALTRDEK